VIALCLSLTSACAISDGCVDKADLKQQMRAQVLVVGEIPESRIIEVYFNDGCDSHDQPVTSMLLSGDSDPVQSLVEDHSWQRLPKQQMADERAFSGARLPFEDTYIVMLVRKATDVERKESGFPQLRMRLSFERRTSPSLRPDDPTV
jgi:hypothetical protein